MFALAAELGVETYPQYDAGETSYELAGSGVLRRERISHPLRRRAGRAREGAAPPRRAGRRGVPVEAPWTAPRAAEWDAITAGAWYDAQGLSPVARTLLEICTVGILAVPTVEVSFLHLLFTIQTCGVTAELFAESEGGAQTTRFVGGTSRDPEPAGGPGRRPHRARRAGAADRAHRRQRHRALPRRAGRPRTPGHRRDLPDAGRADHVRPTAVRRTATSSPNGCRTGSAMKAFFVYDEPFWRATDSTVSSSPTSGPARMSNDTCIPGDDHGVILLFLEGEQARTFGRLAGGGASRGADRRVGAPLRRARPPTRSSTSTGSGRSRQWTRGCYNANCGPLVWTTYGAALAEPIGADPLGVHRYRDPLERLHGGRRRRRRAGRTGSHRRVGEIASLTTRSVASTFPAV